MNLSVGGFMRNKIIILILSLLFTVVSFGKGDEKRKMKFNSSGIDHGKILTKYGVHGETFIDNTPALSIPLEWSEAPKETKQFVVVMEDYDAIPPVGFSWIHWVVIIPGDYKNLEENASRTDKNIIQGANSWVTVQGGKLERKKASFYGGPAPPDKDHTYTFRLYALDKKLDLPNGAYLNEVYSAMKGHILETSLLEGVYAK